MKNLNIRLQFFKHSIIQINIMRNINSERMLMIIGIS